MPWDHKDPLKHCDELITPACIQALYHFEPQDPHAEVSPNNSMGIFEAYTAYLQKDLDDFYKKFTPYIPQGWKPIFDSIDGGVSPAQTKKLGANAEADLDFELAIPIVYPQTTTDFQTDDPYSANNGSFNTFFDGNRCCMRLRNSTADQAMQASTAHTAPIRLTARLETP